MKISQAYRVNSSHVARVPVAAMTADGCAVEALANVVILELLPAAGNGPTVTLAIEPANAAEREATLAAFAADAPVTVSVETAS